jgi:cell division protein FtsL
MGFDMLYCTTKSVPIFTLLLLFVGIVSLFSVKYVVRQENKKLHQVEVEIRQTYENIHVLRAELAYLMRPEHIKNVAEQLLDLFPVKKENVVSLENLLIEQDE